MKVRMSILGGDYVLPLDIANKISDLIADNAEVYEHKWNRGESNQTFYTHHVYELNPGTFNARWDLISEAQYNMYKLAGKPKD